LLEHQLRVALTTSVQRSPENRHPLLRLEVKRSYGSWLGADAIIDEERELLDLERQEVHDAVDDSHGIHSVCGDKDRGAPPAPPPRVAVKGEDLGHKPAAAARRVAKETDEAEQLVLPRRGDAAERVRDHVEALAAAPALPCLVLLREAGWQHGHGAGGRVEHPSYAVARPDEAGQIAAREQLLGAALRQGRPPRDGAGEVQEVDVPRARAAAERAGGEEERARRAAWAARKLRPERTARHERQTVRKRQTELAGRLRKTSNSMSGGRVTPGAVLIRFLAGDRGPAGAIAERVADLDSPAHD
jgi:hypothetical protein